MDVDSADRQAFEPKPILALDESVVNRIAAGEVRPCDATAERLARC